MRHIGIICWAACLVLANGCSPYHCLWGKRASEQKCPTDIRQANCWCFGEDAIFHCPCGPGEEFYGHQPTDWREWPASGADWRDVHCGSPVPLIPYEEEIPGEEDLLYAPSAHMPPASSAATEDPFHNDAPVLNDLNDRASPQLDNGTGKLTPGTQPPLEHTNQQPPPWMQRGTSSSRQSQPMITVAAHFPDTVQQSPVDKVKHGPALTAEIPPTESNRRQAWEFQDLIVEGTLQPMISAHEEPMAAGSSAIAARLPQVDSIEKPTPVAKPAHHAPNSDQALEEDTADALRRLISIAPQSAKNQ